MNKAFVREPELDGRGYCPQCGSLGAPVGKDTLDHHVKDSCRALIGESAWYCEFADCEVAYFDQFERVVEACNLRGPVYPKDPTAPLCACFGFTVEDVDADVREGTPVRIREHVARTKTDEPLCQTLAADGRCCLREIQRLYLRRCGQTGGPDAS